MLAPPQPGITSAAFMAKPILSAATCSASPSTMTITNMNTGGKRPRSPSQPDLTPSVNNMRSEFGYREWVLESEFLGRTRDTRESPEDVVDIKGKGKEKEVYDDTTSPNKRQRTGQPTTTTTATTMQRNDTTSYVLYCPNGRKVLLPSDGIVDVAQLCLWADEAAQTVSSMPTPPSESQSDSESQPQPPRTPKTKAIPLLPSGPPQPIRISTYEPLSVHDLVRLSSHYQFLLTPNNGNPSGNSSNGLDTPAPIDVTKAISLVCPEARLGTNTPSVATETGHLVTHVSRFDRGRWYCRRTPTASVPLMWPANTTLSLPVTQPLPILALPRKLIVHVGPEVGPGAPPPPEVHEEFTGGGMDKLEVVFNPVKGQVFTMPGLDVEEDNARLERVQKPVVDENETEDEGEGTQPSLGSGRQDKTDNGKEPARPVPSARERHRRTPSSTSPPTSTPKKRTRSGSIHRRKLVAESRQRTPVPPPVYPRAGVQGPSNPLDDQKHKPANSPPSWGPHLPRLLSKIPEPYAPQRLPPLRGFIREMDALIRRHRQAVAERRITPPSAPPTPSSRYSSQLPQYLHQHMRQAPVQDRTRYGEQFGEQLEERHRTFEDRLHGIKVKPQPQQQKKQQPSSVTPVQRKKRNMVDFRLSRPSPELMEHFLTSTPMSIQSQWSSQSSTTGSDNSHDN